MLSGSNIRELFLKFFEGKGHTIMPSASLIPESDPTLLWIVAGMQPFKPYFLGKEIPPNTRLTTCQKCVRTNDIENVGKTARHHTFFEMLGNFSFGDYFKSDIIPWAWEFVTEHVKLSPEKLWITIHTNDDEAFELWHKTVGVPADRIVRSEENFWGFGVGPCGPCSEIFYDLDPDKGCGSPDCSPLCECGRYLEFWNLVFIQYNKDESGNLTPLTRGCIDTGMGLERMTSIVQGVATNFDTDLFIPIIKFTADRLGKAYGVESKTDMALKVIADHARAVTFTVGDGVMPSNEGRGYVIRRILRRALRFGKVLGVDKPFLFEVCSKAIDEFGKAYPNLEASREQIVKVVRGEEERFQSTLNQGLSLLDGLIAGVTAAGKDTLTGADVFRLYDTYGFPLEVTQEIAEERGLKVDIKGFEAALEEQRERARAARTEAAYTDAEMQAYSSVMGLRTEFKGYEEDSLTAEVLAILRAGDKVNSVNAGEECEVVLDATPFYAESGGQVGDKGELSWNGGLMSVETAKKPFEGITIHKGTVSKGTLSIGERVSAKIDTSARKATARNHSVTHLLHKSLREVLGEHVHQAGSLVGPERLRFDFSHFSAMTKDELVKVESRVNEMIMENLPVTTELKNLEEARAEGAMALFGEKYGAVVRLVKMGDFSMELCGGTHLRATGEAGLFRILSEGGVAAGVRRIEAVTGFGALSAIRTNDQLLDITSESLKAAREEIPGRVEKLINETKRLEKELSSLKEQSARSSAEALIAKVKKVGDASVLVSEVSSMTIDEMRSFGDYLRDKLGSSVIVIASTTAPDKVSFLSMISKDLTSKVQAGNLVKEAAKITAGGGGGRPDMAQAGGKDPSKLREALDAVSKTILTALS